MRHSCPPIVGLHRHFAGEIAADCGFHLTINAPADSFSLVVRDGGLISFNPTPRSRGDFAVLTSDGRFLLASRDFEAAAEFPPSVRHGSVLLRQPGYCSQRAAGIAVERGIELEEIAYGLHQSRGAADTIPDLTVCPPNDSAAKTPSPTRMLSCFPT